MSSSNQYLSIVAQPVRSTVHVPAFFPASAVLRRYALTGGIGSGKSTIASLFVERGAFLVDADAISRSLMEPGEAVLARTVAEFGEHLLDEDGRLNRPALARIVFNDEQARLRLNAIVHPAIRERAAQLVEQAQSEPGFSGVVLEDIPLLVETGDPSAFEGVVVVRTPWRLVCSASYLRVA